VSVEAVERELSATRLGAAASVAVVGDVEPARAVELVARRLALLPRGRLPGRTDAVVAPEAGPLARAHTGERARVVVAFAAPGEATDADGGLAYSRALGRALSAVPGIRTAFAYGGAHGQTAWASVGLDVDVAMLEALPSLVRGRAPSESAVATERAAIEQGRRWEGALPAKAAARLSRERLFPPRTRALASGSAARALSASAPTFVIGRPR
jgi:hypothetical protein